MSHRVAPILGVIVRPAWETIAEQTLPRSLPMVIYTPRGGIEKSALKGCLPKLEYTWWLMTICNRKNLRLTD